MIFKRIETKCEEQNVNIKDLLKRIPMSANGYYAAKRNNDIKLSTLNKIAKLLDTPIDYFLGVPVNAVNESNPEYNTNSSTMQQILTTVLENNAMLRQITGKEPALVKKKNTKG